MGVPEDFSVPRRVPEPRGSLTQRRGRDATPKDASQSEDPRGREGTESAEGVGETDGLRRGLWGAWVQRRTHDGGSSAGQGVGVSPGREGRPGSRWRDVDAGRTRGVTSQPESSRPWYARVCPQECVPVHGSRSRPKASVPSPDYYI